MIFHLLVKKILIRLLTGQFSLNFFKSYPNNNHFVPIADLQMFGLDKMCFFRFEDFLGCRYFWRKNANFWFLIQSGIFGVNRSMWDIFSGSSSKIKAICPFEPILAKVLIFKVNEGFQRNYQKKNTQNDWNLVLRSVNDLCSVFVKERFSPLG